MAKSLKKLLLSIGCLLLIPGIVCGASTPVNWSIPSIKSKITIGEQKKLLVTFTSQAKLQNVEIWVVPKLQPFIKIEPNKFKSISAKVGYQLEISLFAPPEVRADVYKGTIHLRVGNRTYPMPLQVGLDVHPVENRPPVAIAGQYPTAEVKSLVTLDGSQSYDPDGDLITYNWSFVSIPQESSTSLENPTSAKATFTPDAEGLYEISLQVNDSKGAVDQDITIVEAFLPNVPPVAEAGANQTAVTGLKVCLDGSQSSDKDGDSLTFLWTMVSWPQGSTASLDNSISLQPCFTPDKDGRYTVRLVVDDGISESVPDDVSIDAASPNAPPVANAGEDRTISKNNVITLDGTGSYDPDNDPLTYNWSIISKPLDSTSVLTGSTSSKPTILADKEGIFVFHLLVEDSWYRSAYDDVAITVINDPPVALIETAGTQVMNEVITLDGTKSSDPNRDNLSFAWLIRTAPGGSSCAIANSSAASTTIRPDRPGRYIIDLTVNDGSLTDTDFTSLDIGVRVPNLVGLTRAQAEDLIRQSFLAVGSASYDANTAPAGQVINQTPAEQTIVPGGTSVSIVLSTGTQTPLPPDPSTVATQIDPTVATTVAASTSFLYSGSNPIQSGVVPGAIEPKRQGVLRGKVINRDETPLPGVTIRILGRLDYGQTLSRSDGMFDMAVNGGETIVVEFSRPGHLTAQRQVVSPTQDYGFIADVVLIPKDRIATAIDLTSSLPMQTAQGTIINDSSGTRKGVLLFPSGTTAEAVLTNDSVQPLTNINVRITEYSTGPSGPKAMPAKLPPTVGYTYCVEFGVDQADALGAKEVRFSQPLYHYVNNFLNFPVGMIVPVAYYDRAKAAWIPSDNGKVIKITGVNSGIAVLDTTGTNVDNGAALGITEAERRAIATLFNIGDSLWRAPITHFTPWDLNWGVWLPTDAVGPQVTAPVAADPIDNPCTASGSRIECQNQVLGETVKIVGTPFSLNYSSDRVPGRTAAQTMKIPLSGAAVPSSLKRIDLEIIVAGQRLLQSFPVTTNLSTTFTWDRLDAYGRTVQGSQPINVRIGYVYDGVYQSPADMAKTFGRVSGIPITGSASRSELILWQEQRTGIYSWDALAQGLGAWTLDVNHVYDPNGSILYSGDGSRRSAQSVGSMIKTVAGGGGFPYQDNVPATQTYLNNPTDVAVKPDGSFYTTETRTSVNRKIDHVGIDGIIRNIAGVYDCTAEGVNDDGIPATSACISANCISIGPDGQLYLSSDNRVRRIDPDGRIWTVAGQYPSSGYGGDGGNATEAFLWSPEGIAFGIDGSLYIAEPMNRVVRQITPDGKISTVAGNRGTASCLCACDDGKIAQNAALNHPNDVAVGPDGSLYIADYSAIRKVGIDGKIATVICGLSANASSLPKSWEEGIPASDSYAGRIRSIKFGRDGALYYSACDEKYGADTYCFVRRIGSDGRVSTVAGGRKGFGGDGGNPNQASIDLMASPGGGIDLGPDGTLFIADTNNNRIRQLSKAFPGQDLTQMVIPSADGMNVFKFDANGRHVETTHALTGAVLYVFRYDLSGRLVQIEDGSGNVTQVERDGSGNPISITGPYGDRTTVTLDVNGYFSKINSPANESFSFIYTQNGLLNQMIDPRGNTRQYQYDDSGYLVRNEAPEGFSQTFYREEIENGFRVTKKSALDRTTAYVLEKLSTGQNRNTVTFPNGTFSQTVENAVTSAIKLPDLTVINFTKGGDPRFGMQAPIYKEFNTQTSTGLLNTIGTTRNVTLLNPNDPLSVSTANETIMRNGRTYVNQFNSSARTYTMNTPAGRYSYRNIDFLGRVVQTQTGNLNAIRYTYDAQGRLRSIKSGTGEEERTITFDYNAQGKVESILNALNHLTSFQYDSVGRIISKTLPDMNSIALGYDSNGNLISVTPPGKEKHVLTYNGLNSLSGYLAPGASKPVLYSYNIDRQLTEISRSDGRSLNFIYDAVGQLSMVNDPDVSHTFEYNANNGRIQSISTSNGERLTLSFDGSFPLREVWTGSVSGNVEKSYDNDVRIVEEKINGANSIVFSYDIDGLIVSIGEMIVERNSVNGLISGTQLDSIVENRGYNNFGEVTTHVISFGSTNLYNAQYTYDKLGRIVSKIETIPDATVAYEYGYDQNGRLSEVKKNGTLTSAITYDSNGNRSSTFNGTSTITGVYDSQDRLLRYGTGVYAYTPDGEVATKTNNGTTTYQYDTIGNLRSVNLSNGNEIQYVIDGMNRRIGKKVNGTLVKGFLYTDKLRPIVELDGENKIVSRFVYGSRATTPYYMIRNGNHYMIITDHLGSPKIVVNSQTGEVAQRMDYDEFGKVMLDTNPGFQPFGFAGGLYDADTGLTRFGVRDYDAGIGRWTSRDPILFKGNGSNLYAYSYNDPINFLDSYGLSGINAHPYNFGFDMPVSMPIDLSSMPSVGSILATMPTSGAQNEIGSLISQANQLSGGINTNVLNNLLHPNSNFCAVIPISNTIIGTPVLPSDLQAGITNMVEGQFPNLQNSTSSFLTNQQLNNFNVLFNNTAISTSEINALIEMGK